MSSRGESYPRTCRVNPTAVIVSACDGNDVGIRLRCVVALSRRVTPSDHGAVSARKGEPKDVYSHPFLRPSSHPFLRRLLPDLHSRLAQKVRLHEHQTISRQVQTRGYTETRSYRVSFDRDETFRGRTRQETAARARRKKASGSLRTKQRMSNGEEVERGRRR